MNNITVIIPIHIFNENYIKNAINSVPQNINILIVSPKNVIDEIKKINKRTNISYIENNDDTDFYNQINIGAKNCKSEYFSILEYDDMYTPIWFKNVEKYIKYYNDFSIFLPLIKIIKYDNHNIQSLGNELAWSNAFVDESGVINDECLNNYYDFIISGGVFKTKDFIDCGGLKKSLLIASPYEFLLRMAHNGKQIYVIPKIGYEHYFGNPNGFSMKNIEKISQKHIERLIKISQEEKYFKNERNIVFEE